MTTFDDDGQRRLLAAALKLCVRDARSGNQEAFDTLVNTLGFRAAQKVVAKPAQKLLIARKGKEKQR